MKGTPNQKEIRGGGPVGWPIADRLSPARLVAVARRRGDGTPLIWGLVGTLLVHAAVFLLAPARLPKAERVERPVDSLEVLLVAPEEEERPDEFVATNPEVPSNVPDETDFFSNRDQQAAQEEKSDSGDPSLPDVEGEEPEPNQNLVESESVLPVPLEQILEELLAGQDGGFPLRPPPERAVPGFEPVEEGEGLDVPVTPETDQPVDESPVFGVDLGADDGERDVPESETESERELELQMADGTDGMGEAERPVMPRPRPRLPQFSQGPTGSRQGAAPRVGVISVDANFSEYGDYLARMLDAIVRQWHNLAWESLRAGEVGTVVAVEFRVDSTGVIHGLEVLVSTASLTATLICQDAVSSRQPYGDWTADMKEVLGEEQTVRIRFHYR